MTDDAESRVDAGAVTDNASDESEHGVSIGEADSEPAVDGEPVDFADLSLPQRAFVAAVQNPTRGVMIAGLLAFAFSFYIAFWLVFPRVAAFMSAVGLLLIGIIAAVYVLSDRFSG